jgi:hypothetical protein
MKTRKPTEKIIDELIELRKTRKSIDDFIHNHLTNFHDNAKLAHFILQNKDSSHSLKNTAHRQYFVFLVSSIETFFRDIFIYIHSADKILLTKIIEKFNISHKLEKIEPQELLSKSFNFQNIDNIREAFNNLWHEDFLQKICTTQISPCGMNGKIFHHFSISELFPDWLNTLNSLFEVRHRVVHDANYRTSKNMKLIQIAEALTLLIPQIATYLIAQKYKLPSLTLQSTNTNPVPYLFSIHDVLADDWYITE